MADKDEADSTEESNATAEPAAGEDTQTPSGSHAFDADADAEPGHEPDSEVTEEPEGFADTEDDPAPDLDDKELVTVGAATKGVQAGAERESNAAARAQKKNKATPRQKQAVEEKRRTGPVKFLKESASELQKVVYPTGQQLVNYFIVVLIFVLFIIAIVSALDLAFGKAILAIFS